MRSDLSDEARKKVNTLIIIDVHARDIIDTFVRDSIMDAREFAWESQLRFYWDRQQDDINIRQCTVGTGGTRLGHGACCWFTGPTAPSPRPQNMGCVCGGGQHSWPPHPLLAILAPAPAPLLIDSANTCPVSLPRACSSTGMSTWA